MKIEIFAFSVIFVDDCLSALGKSFSKSINSFFRDKATIRHTFDKDTNMNAPKIVKSSIRDPDKAYKTCKISRGLISLQDSM